MRWRHRPPWVRHVSIDTTRASDATTDNSTWNSLRRDWLWLSRRLNCLSIGLLIYSPLCSLLNLHSAAATRACRKFSLLVEWLRACTVGIRFRCYVRWKILAEFNFVPHAHPVDGSRWISVHLEHTSKPFLRQNSFLHVSSSHKMSGFAAGFCWTLL